MAPPRGRDEPGGKRSSVPEYLAVTAFFIFVFPVLAMLRGGGEFHPNAYLFGIIVTTLISGLVWLVAWLRRKVKRRSRSR